MNPIAHSNLIRTTNFRARPSFLTRSLCFLAVASTAIIVSPAHAASSTWSSGPASDAWSNTGNWAGGNVPGAADTGTFSNAISGTIGTSTDPIVIDSGRTITGITFTTSAGNYVIGGSGANNTLGLTSAGNIQILAGLTGSNKTETVNAPLSIGSGAAAATETFTNAATDSTDVLDFGGQIGSGTSGTTTLTVTGVNTGANTISGNIVNGSGTTALSKTAAGTWVLSGTGNSYTGATAVSAGTLKLNGSLTGATAISVTSTGTLAESTAGVISGTGASVTVNGLSAVATLAGANTYTGGTTLTQGTLNLNNANAIPSTGTLTLTTGTIDNTSGSAVTLANNPTILFSGSPSAIIFGGSNNLNLGSGVVDFATGPNIVLSGTNNKTLTMGTLTNSSAGSTNVAVNFAAGSSGGSLTVGGYTNSLATQVLNAAVSGNGNVIMAGNITDSSSTTGGLFSYQGTGTFTLTGDALETGNFKLTGTSVGPQAYGTILLSNGGTIGSATKSLTLNVFNGNLIEDSLSADVNGAVTVQGGTALFQGANTTTGALTATGAVNGVTPNFQTSLSAGVVTLAGLNGTFSATTSVALANGGFLTLNNTAAAGGNNNNRINDAATLAFTGGSLVYLGSDAPSTSSTETITGAVTTGRGTITVAYGGTNAATLTLGTFAAHTAGTGDLFVNGTNLGEDNSSTTSVARLMDGAGPTLTGSTTALSSGINSSAKNTGIVAYMVGEATQTSGGKGTATGVANTFVTYNSGTGFRPLNPTDEFTNNSFVTGNNTYITSATTLTTTGTINSLVINGGDVTVTDGQTLADTSGALLFVTSNNLKPSTSSGAFTTASGTEFNVYVDPGISGTISAVVAANGVNAFTKSGTGTLVLSGANTYTGVTTVSGGVLNLQNATALGSSATNGVTVNFGSELQLQGGISIATAKTLTINGAGTDGTRGALDNVSGNNSYAGAIAMGSLSQINSESGTLTLSGGTSGVNALTLTGAGSGVESGAIANGGSTLTKNGTGTWTLTGTNTFTGGVTVNRGVLTVSGSGSLASTGPLSLGGGTFNYNPSSAATQTISAFSTPANVPYAGYNVLDVGTNGTLATTTITTRGDEGNLIDFNDTTTGTITTKTANTNGILGTWAITGSGSTLAYVTSAGTGTANAAGNLSAYSGATAATASTTTGGTTNYDYSSGGTLGLSVASSAFTLRSTGGATTITAASGLTVNGLMNGGTGSLTISSGTVTIGNGTGTSRELDIVSNGQNITISSVIADSSSGTSYLAYGGPGAGTLTLSGANTYSAATFVDSGTLALTGAGTLGAGSASLADLATVDLGGTSQSVGALNGYGVILNSSGSTTSTLTFGNGAVATPANGTFSGVIEDNSGSGGTVAVVKSGTGFEVLNGANTFTGGVTVNSGMLIVGSLSSVGTAQALGKSGTVTLAGTSAGGPGILQYTGGTGTLSQAVTVATGKFGTIYNFGSGVLTLAGAISKSGSVLNLTGGKFVETGGITGALANSDLNVVNNATVGLTTANSYVGPTSVSGNSTLLTGVTGAIPTNSALTLGASGDAGVNTVDLLGTSQIVTGLTVAAGSGATNQVISSNGSAFTPAIGGAASSTTATLTVNYTGSSTDTYTGSLGGSGASTNLALSKTGTGTLALANLSGNTYTGGTSVTAGALLLINTSNSATGTGSLTVSAGAVLAGTGRSSGSSFSVAGTGTTTATEATVLVGQTSTADTNTTATLTLLGSGASSISNANLVFNLNVNTPGQATQLNVGSTAITFGTGVTLTLNMDNTPGIVGAYTSYTLVDGTTNSQYSGLTTFSNALGQLQITSLSLSFSDALSQTYYSNGSYLYLANGDIDVEVVPEPSTWAMMAGGLAALLFWQRRKSRQS